MKASVTFTYAAAFSPFERNCGAIPPPPFLTNE